jgi:hypothetical protein
MINDVVDAGEFAYVNKAILRGDHFMAWVELVVARDTLRRDPKITLDKDWGVGYQLDGSTIAGLHPLVRSSDLTMILSFSHLKSGPHHLRVGLISPDGQLRDDNAYCFSSPGKFTLTGP